MRGLAQDQHTCPAGRKRQGAADFRQRPERGGKVPAVGEPHHDTQCRASDESRQSCRLRSSVGRFFEMIAARSVPEIRAAIALFEAWEASINEVNAAKRFGEAMQLLDDYLESEPDSPHRQF